MTSRERHLRAVDHPLDLYNEPLDDGLFVVGQSPIRAEGSKGFHEACPFVCEARDPWPAIENQSQRPKISTITPAVYEFLHLLVDWIVGIGHATSSPRSRMRGNAGYRAARAADRRADRAR